jgi:acetyltransferase-like isoleucine patch superfamily enzyme
VGRSCLVGANAVVTKSFPSFSVIAGNPAEFLTTYDEQTRRWSKPHE